MVSSLSSGEYLQSSGNVTCNSLCLLFGKIAHKGNHFIDSKLISPPLTYKHDILHLNFQIINVIDRETFYSKVLKLLLPFDFSPAVFRNFTVMSISKDERFIEGYTAFDMLK